MTEEISYKAVSNKQNFDKNSSWLLKQRQCQANLTLRNHKKCAFALCNKKQSTKNIYFEIRNGFEKKGKEK